MILVIYLFCLFLIIASAVLLISPALLFEFISRNAHHTALYVTAIVARLLLGSTLLYTASLSRYPLAVSVIGILSIIAALVFLLIGKQRFNRLMDWLLSSFRPWARAGGIVTLLFAAFLLYCFA